MTINEVCLKLLNTFIEVCDAHKLKIFRIAFMKTIYFLVKV